MNSSAQLVCRVPLIALHPFVSCQTPNSSKLVQPFSHILIQPSPTNNEHSQSPNSSLAPQSPMPPTLYYTRDTPAFTGFQPEPAGRGTAGIIWTCISTILLSSWSSFHGEAYDPNKSSKEEARKLYGLRFTYSFLLPEAGAVESFENLFDALRLRNTVAQVGGPEFANFSLAQAFIFVKNSVYRRSQGSEETKWVGPQALVKLVSNGSLSFSVLPTDDEIADKSKRDWTLKLLSIIQTLWFIVNIIARLDRGYTVSLIEDITVGNAFCGVIEFACWFYCPQDIRLSFIIKPDVSGTANGQSVNESREPQEESASDRGTLLVSADGARNKASSRPPVSVTENPRGDRWSKELPISERPSPLHKKPKRRATFAPQTSEFEGASEKIFINYSFPSVTETWIWRGGSITLVLLGLCMSFIRTMMLGVALASFRKAPMRLYETPSWTPYWPHI
ncbi:hypothetical protein QBC32DRAFT_371678 [Pseudoneurospora amorphoporcata]|uniref:Uncharacterized protein n=1 Tax=Pseudoneurospora amorphoporcata TaxID=241081 RepID=A0AAN6NTE1_9PEZI|nr:hypothetical protein QBC32DRAFT_371678 [Pseudoneurospora amorphoporcata]